MTVGEDRIQLLGSDSTEIIALKRRVIDLIDWCESQKKNPANQQERMRLLHLAQHEFEHALLWTLKAATL
jgi:hypothetical protein